MKNELRRFSLVLDFNDQAGAKKIVDTINKKVCESLKASIVDVRFYREAMGGAVLESFASTGPGTSSKRELFIVNENPVKEKTGVWSWVVKHNKPLWIEEIPSDLSDESLTNLATKDKDIIGNGYTKIASNTRSIIVAPSDYEGVIWGIYSIELDRSGIFNKAMFDIFLEFSKYFQRIIKKSNIQELKKGDAEKAVDLFCDKLQNFNFKDILKTSPTGFFSRQFAPANKEVEQCIVSLFADYKIEVKSFSSETSRQVVTEQILMEIEDSDFGIVDITGLRPNVLIELGYLINSGKELYILQHHEDNRECPFNLSNHQCFEYKIVHPKSNETKLEIYHLESNRWLPLEDVFLPFIEKLSNQFNYKESS